MPPFQGKACQATIHFHIVGKMMCEMVLGAGIENSSNTDRKDSSIEMM